MTMKSSVLLSLFFLAFLLPAQTRSFKCYQMSQLSPADQEFANLQWKVYKFDFQEYFVAERSFGKMLLNPEDPEKAVKVLYLDHDTQSMGYELDFAMFFSEKEEMIIGGGRLAPKVYRGFCVFDGRYHIKVEHIIDLSRRDIYLKKFIWSDDY